VGAVKQDFCEQAVFDSQRLEQVFERCFLAGENTRLVGGAREPLYQPAAAAGTPHLLFYREDYFASALHEISHWCIAGPERRQLQDFGYWYAPEGRSPAQQRAFEAVEVKPQTLEWYFSQACGYPFRVSVDNFDPVSGALPDTHDFRQRLEFQARQWQVTGLPSRAKRFFYALAAEYGNNLAPGDAVFHSELIN
jgi:elongation factor P hydroxylase